MSILIHGIPMPKSCSECKLDLRTDICKAFCEWNAEHPYSIRATDRLPDCPLSEVPEREDAVSRADVVDMLEMYPFTEYGEYETAREVVKRLPSVTPKQQWIPCSEKLPEDDGTYIVSGEWGSGKVSVGECEYYKHDGYFRTAWNFDVIAWMPMPEPWRGEGEK